MKSAPVPQRAVPGARMPLLGSNGAKTGTGTGGASRQRDELTCTCGWRGRDRRAKDHTKHHAYRALLRIQAFEDAHEHEQTKRQNCRGEWVACSWRELCWEAKRYYREFIAEAG